MNALKSPHLLEVRNLSLSAPAAGEAAEMLVDNASFTLARGEMLALVGESGSGKTLTALSILKLLPTGVRRDKGEVFLRGQDVSARSEVSLMAIRGKQVSMVFQEPMSALNPLHTIGRQIGEAIALHQALWPDAMQKRIRELLTLVGLESLHDRLNAYPHELSGGQRQRVCIAMALANKPDVLIADEPTTALDVTVQAQILALLKDLRQKLGMAVLLITHDLTLVERMADRVAIMQKGRIIETGTVKEVFGRPKQAYTKALLDAAPKGKPVTVGGKAGEVLAAEHLSIRFPLEKNFFGKVKKSLSAVDDLSFTLKAGRTLGIVGESGSGKTTAALAALRLIGSEGSIRFEGMDLKALSEDDLRPLRKRMQIVFQDPFGSLNPRLTVGDAIAEGLRAHQMFQDNPAAEDKKIVECLKEMGLDPASRHRYPHEFSGGQRQRISIARALAVDPSLIVFDEPTSALDLATQSHILELLKNLQKKRKLAYIFISHDLRVVRSIAHDIVVMKGGKVVEHGTNLQVFSRPRSPYTKALIESAFGER